MRLPWGITLDIQADDILLTIDTAVPCGLILNELVSNALKHAFPNGKGGQIQIKIHEDGESHVTLAITDDGIGFPADLDFSNTNSLGLQLVNSLVNQLDGIIEIACNGETEFKITFSTLQE